MIDRTAEELLNRSLDAELDAELGPDEAAALEALLASSPEARRYQALLLELGRLLGPTEQQAGGTAGEEQPPRELVADVMRAIEARGEPGRGSASGAAQNSAGRAGWSGTPRTSLVRQAMTLAAGVVLGVLLAAATGWTERLAEPAGESAAATMLAGRSGEASGLLDRTRFDEGELRGLLTTRWVEGRVELEIRLDSAVPAEALVRFEPRALTPKGFERSDGTGGELALGRDLMRLTRAGAGSHRLTLSVNEGSNSELFIVLTAGSSRFEKTVEVRPNAG